MNRRSLLLATLLAPLAANGARAATQHDFTQAEFDAAQKSGKPILVHIQASWCPTCAKQRPIIAQLATDPANKDLLILSVDFDAQKDVVRAFGAKMQSTLVVFRAGKEQDRSVGATDPAVITALVAKTRA